MFGVGTGMAPVSGVVLKLGWHWCCGVVLCCVEVEELVEVAGAGGCRRSCVSATLVEAWSVSSKNGEWSFRFEKNVHEEVGWGSAGFSVDYIATQAVSEYNESLYQIALELWCVIVECMEGEEDEVVWGVVVDKKGDHALSYGVVVVP
ncbi:hypothetical protein DEO72_LG4g1670 [Vigna unguiculata]|uniref:Uncharacterized protein n=1 Tax=Vigna unguiculata TaxID=3917 RepID=A0A4D6LP54_VIGUN|nr:hypothetical protein DEO72_LG4g1670 [Vigna unguiculata]